LGRCCLISGISKGHARTRKFNLCKQPKKSPTPEGVAQGWLGKSVLT
jgi:hypothetical protein